MKLSFLLSCIIVADILFSCSTPEPKNSSLLHIKVGLEQVTDNIKYSELLEDVKCIKLETKDSLNVLIDVDKVLIDEDKIFILDKYRFQGIMTFDTSGRFLFSKKVGGGAEGEFTHLSGMSIDRKKKELIIFSTPKLLYYSYDGKFLRAKKLDFLANDFEFNGCFFTFIGQEYGIIATDSLGKILFQNFESKKIYPLKFLQPFQTYSNEGILFRHSLNDTIYLVKQSGLEKYAYIDFQDKKIFPSEVENMIKNNIREMPRNKMGRIKYFFDTKNIVYFAFEYNQMLYIAFYDKRTKKTKIIRGNAKEQNDLTMEDTLPYIVGVHQDQFIAVVNAQNIFLDLKNLMLNKLSMKIIKSFQNKGEANSIHNPNLILMNFK